jgi:hypothetical protein
LKERTFGAKGQSSIIGLVIISALFYYQEDYLHATWKTLTPLLAFATLLIIYGGKGFVN